MIDGFMKLPGGVRVALEFKTCNPNAPGPLPPGFYQAQITKATLQPNNMKTPVPEYPQVACHPQSQSDQRAVLSYAHGHGYTITQGRRRSNAHPSLRATVADWNGICARALDAMPIALGAELLTIHIEALDDWHAAVEEKRQCVAKDRERAIAAHHERLHELEYAHLAPGEYKVDVGTPPAVGGVNPFPHAEKYHVGGTLRPKCKLTVVICGEQGEGKSVLAHIIAGALIKGVHCASVTPAMRKMIREKGVHIVEEGTGSGPGKSAGVVLELGSGMWVPQAFAKTQPPIIRDEDKLRDIVRRQTSLGHQAGVMAAKEERMKAMGALLKGPLPTKPIEIHIVGATGAGKDNVRALLEQAINRGVVGREEQWGEDYRENLLNRVSFHEHVPGPEHINCRCTLPDEFPKELLHVMCPECFAVFAPKEGPRTKPARHFKRDKDGHPITLQLTWGTDKETYMSVEAFNILHSHGVLGFAPFKTDVCKLVFKCSTPPDKKWVELIFTLVENNRIQSLVDHLAGVTGPF